jgi:hypothetical protein
MKIYIKLCLIIFALSSSLYGNAQDKKIIQGFDLCTPLSISGPDSLNSSSSNITYSITSLGSLPSGYNYMWSTSNNNALQIITGQGTSSITVNYTNGNVELNVSVFKDASSVSCCMSKTITQANVPVVPPFRTIKAISCPTANGVGQDCTQNTLTWSLQLVDVNGNSVIGTVDWLESGNALGLPTTIDSIISTSGANMTGNNNDCYAFTVICKYDNYYYYGSFRTPASGTSETCNSQLAYDSGYYTGNTSSGFVKTATGWRQTLIDNGIIN